VSLDPSVELLPDVPISGPDEDLLDRDDVAMRLVELACAQPHAQPRVVALTGPAGAGKTSVLHLAVALLAERADAACVKLDGADHAGADALLKQMIAHLTAFFSEAGVVDAADSIRDTIAGYGEVVSHVARLGGVKVDVGGALSRSAEDIRVEIAEMAQEVGKRIVIVLDHTDRLPPRELSAAMVALRHYAAIPYVTIVLALDRRELARRLPHAELDPATIERAVQVELALPPADRVLLARVVAGGLGRTAARLHRDIDALLPLFDPEGGTAIAMIETPRDAKRVANAITAALPLWPTGPAARDACLDAVIRLLVPELDGPLLDRGQLDELDAALVGHRRGPATRVALRDLLGG
jgi:hypothetical protein